MGYNITYNISAINSSDPTAYYRSVNSLLGNTPAYGVMLIIYIAVFVYYVNNDVARAHVAASAVTSGVSVLFLFMGLIPANILMIPIGLLVIGLLVLSFID